MTEAGTPFWRVDYRDDVHTSGVDFFYSSTEIGALDYIFKETRETERDLKSPWWWFLWLERLDVENDCERLGVFDWFGNEVPAALVEVGWQYGHDLKPEFIKPHDEGCPICRENLEREIAKHT